MLKSKQQDFSQRSNHKITLLLAHKYSLTIALHNPCVGGDKSVKYNKTVK